MDFIEEKRREVDKIDDKLVELLGKRFDVVKEIVSFKKQNDIPIEDKSREDTIKARYLMAGLPEGFSDKFFDELFDEAKKEGFVDGG